MTMTHRNWQSPARGFSLIEVLLATFILAIGLIMVATLFPVGANWTRQATEDTVAQTIAQDAVAVIRDYYGPGSQNPQTSGKLALIASSGTPYLVQGLPNFTAIPLAERTYQFGNTTPFPAPNAPGCTYYWTALGRLSPRQSTLGVSNSYDIYVLVFRKGEASQTFYNSTTVPNSYTDMGSSSVPNPVRDTDESKFPTNDSRYANFKHYFEPTLIVGPYQHGTYSASASPAIPDCAPPLGFIGLGQTSGTVFRQIPDINNNQANARPPLAGQGTPTAQPSEQIIYAPPADGTTASPLIYVFQTAVTF